MNEDDKLQALAPKLQSLEEELSTLTTELYLQQRGLLPPRSVLSDTVRASVHELETQLKGEPLLLQDIQKRYKNLQDDKPDIVEEHQDILLNAQQFRGWFQTRFNIDIGDTGENPGIPDQQVVKKGKKPQPRHLNLKDGILFCLNEETLRGMVSTRRVNPKQFLEVRQVWSAALAESIANFRPLLSPTTTIDEIEGIQDWIKRIRATDPNDLDADNVNRYADLLERQLRHRGEELSPEEIESMVARMHRLPKRSVKQLVSNLSLREAKQFASHFNTLVAALKQTVNDSKLTGEHLLTFAGLGDLASQLIKDPNERNIFMTTVDQWVKRPAQAIMHESLDGYYNHQTTLWKLSERQAGQSGNKETYRENFRFPTHKISRVSLLAPATSTEQPQKNTPTSKWMKAISNIVKPRMKSNPQSTAQQKTQPVSTKRFDLSFLGSAHKMGLAKCTSLMKDEIQKAGYTAPRFEVIDGANTREPEWVASISSLDDKGEKREVTTNVAQKFAGEVVATISNSSPSLPTFGQIGEFLATLSLYQEKLGLQLSTLQHAASAEESNKRGVETPPPATATGGPADAERSWLELDSSPDDKRSTGSLREVDALLKQGEISVHNEPDGKHIEIQKVTTDECISYAVHIDMTGKQRLKISFQGKKVADGYTLEGLPGNPMINNKSRPKLKLVTKQDGSPIALQGKVDPTTHMLTFLYSIEPGAVGAIGGHLSIGLRKIIDLPAYTFAAPDTHGFNVLASISKDVKQFREQMKGKGTSNSRQTSDGKSDVSIPSKLRKSR